MGWGWEAEKTKRYVPPNVRTHHQPGLAKAAGNKTDKISDFSCQLWENTGLRGTGWTELHYVQSADARRWETLHGKCRQVGRGGEETWQSKETSTAKQVSLGCRTGPWWWGKHSRQQSYKEALGSNHLNRPGGLPSGEGKELRQTPFHDPVVLGQCSPESSWNFTVYDLPAAYSKWRGKMMISPASPQNCPFLQWWSLYIGIPKISTAFYTYFPISRVF